MDMDLLQSYQLAGQLKYLEVRHIELFERTFEFSDLHQFKENLDAFFKYLEEWWEIEIGDVYFCTRAE